MSVFPSRRRWSESSPGKSKILSENPPTRLRPRFPRRRRTPVRSTRHVPPQPVRRGQKVLRGRLPERPELGKVPCPPPENPRRHPRAEALRVRALPPRRHGVLLAFHLRSRHQQRSRQAHHALFQPDEGHSAVHGVQDVGQRGGRRTVLGGVGAGHEGHRRPQGQERFFLQEPSQGHDFQVDWNLFSTHSRRAGAMGFGSGRIWLDF